MMCTWSSNSSGGDERIPHHNRSRRSRMYTTQVPRLHGVDSVACSLGVFCVMVVQIMVKLCHSRLTHN
jgi:hypothetical protein